MVIIRGAEKIPIGNGLESIQSNIKSGDILQINEIKEAVQNIEEYLELMYCSFKEGYDITGNGIDTRVSSGAIMRNFCYGLYEFGEKEFGK